MVKRFWCWLWGHRTVWKDYNDEVTVKTYTRATWCTRCGVSLAPTIIVADEIDAD